MIKLTKSVFYKEEETKKKLCEFIMGAQKLSNGEKCQEFQKVFAAYQGREYAVLYSSGSAANLALIQALLNLNKLKKEDKVGFSAVTWATNVMPLIQLGLEAVPIDISIDNLNVNSENILEVLKKTDIKALFITNLLGFCGDLDKIKEICDSRGIILLEDNCESLGSELKGKKLGNFGLASTFSFFVGHHMSTIEGGMVCTDDEKLWDMLVLVRAHGWSRDLSMEKRIDLRQNNNINDFNDRYTFYNLGYNLRPTEITGFLGLEQMRYLAEIIKKRNENFKEFHMNASKNPDFILVDVSHMDFVSNFDYPIVFDNKDKFEKYKNLFNDTVEIRPIVGGSIVQQPFFIDYMKKMGKLYQCPNAEKVHFTGFYFPNNPELTRDELDQIIKMLLLGRN